VCSRPVLLGRCDVRADVEVGERRSTRARAARQARNAGGNWTRDAILELGPGSLHTTTAVLVDAILCSAAPFWLRRAVPHRVSPVMGRNGRASPEDPLGHPGISPPEGSVCPNIDARSGPPADACIAVAPVPHPVRRVSLGVLPVADLSRRWCASDEHVPRSSGIWVMITATSSRAGDSFNVRVSVGPERCATQPAIAVLARRLLNARSCPTDVDGRELTPGGGLR
jgi:hypothetical protein